MRTRVASVAPSDSSAATVLETSISASSSRIVACRPRAARRLTGNRRRRVERLGVCVTDRSRRSRILIPARGSCSAERVAQGFDRCLKLKNLVSSCRSRRLRNRVLRDAEFFDLLVKRDDGLSKLRDLVAGGDHRLVHARFACDADRLQLVAKRDDRLSQLADLALGSGHGSVRTSLLFEANRVELLSQHDDGLPQLSELAVSDRRPLRALVAFRGESLVLFV